ncbi:hypothetical protein PPERSA_02254 [Pseudocohnilembus persalinus]|uniref:PARP-type domain-containing protein n=1 Tax=Pseudocohnilembus persalinus TaxID=266149 RepID=A0A0V0QKX5_PSEPJ|nr:hypothetical protein PPERSA_02254 [Pseudocohnilembus persalinus]|eukprot:KRX02764.1 hypothetical protein PPERSA_02254 [Pseudocohnilembus persalinus]
MYEINEDSYEEIDNMCTEMTKPRWVTCEYAKSGKALCRGCNKKIQIRALRIGVCQQQTEHFHVSVKWVDPQCLKKIRNISHIFKRMKPDQNGKFYVKGLQILIPQDQDKVQQTLQQLYNLNIGDDGKIKPSKKKKKVDDDDWNLNDINNSIPQKVTKKINKQKVGTANKKKKK